MLTPVPQKPSGVIQGRAMPKSVGKLIRDCDVEGLARYVREAFGITVTADHLRGILEQSKTAGGPVESPWSDGTWKVWLRGQATQVPLLAPDASHEFPAPGSLAFALDEAATALLTVGSIQICRISHWDDLQDDYPEDSWNELFPVFARLDHRLTEEFEARGGKAFLGKAPLASWLLARLEYLGIAEAEEENDLGGFLTNFLIQAEQTPAGVISIVADSRGVELDFQGRAAEVGNALISLLVHDIRAVARCELQVRGAEIKYMNSYGWSGESFLGASNMSG